MKQNKKLIEQVDELLNFRGDTRLRIEKLYDFFVSLTNDEREVVLPYYFERCHLCGIASGKEIKGDGTISVQSQESVIPDLTQWLHEEVVSNKGLSSSKFAEKAWKKIQSYKSEEKRQAALLILASVSVIPHVPFKSPKSTLSTERFQELGAKLRREIAQVRRVTLIFEEVLEDFAPAGQYLEKVFSEVEDSNGRAVLFAHLIRFLRIVTLYEQDEKLNWSDEQKDALGQVLIDMDIADYPLLENMNAKAKEAKEGAGVKVLVSADKAGKETEIFHVYVYRLARMKKQHPDYYEAYTKAKEIAESLSEEDTPGRIEKSLKIVNLLYSFEEEKNPGYAEYFEASWLFANHLSALCLEFYEGLFQRLVGGEKVGADDFVPMPCIGLKMSDGFLSEDQGATVTTEEGSVYRLEKGKASRITPFSSALEQINELWYKAVCCLDVAWENAGREASWSRQTVLKFQIPDIAADLTRVVNQLVRNLAYYSFWERDLVTGFDDEVELRELFMERFVLRSPVVGFHLEKFLTSGKETLEHTIAKHTFISKEAKDLALAEYREVCSWLGIKGKF
ncbi:hypothetical protein HN858_00450 [Candidatus Falkowbacteria bacterium]|jgi:hypothetical protein|nr:hypothetical protein [Candidatus Falkowbacteria bacterium]MBT5503734.1 hypothetical protein [Candidatus Falkowbacteria bacterium]MBT6573787.1 hypothetical protein [Candidatus Falkowbacteria bacterium]MBT7348123.1 hypothetical protein [Candidatus Falkowbacteria bacterium]MBT7500709.1 hypothetical protein [Candidatus Falkowbacteria bacterium]